MQDRLSPMFCQSAKEESLAKLDWSSYYVEPKLDGARAILVKGEDGTVQIYSRANNEFTHHVPSLVSEVEGSNIPSGTVLDGELGLINRIEEADGKDIHFFDFNRSLRVLGSLPERGRTLQEEYGVLSFVAFDIQRYGGEWVEEATYSQRRDLLEQVGELELLKITATWSSSSALEVYNKILDKGGEGIVLKNKDGIYSPGKRPSKNMYKVKVQKRGDFIVTGFKPGTGKYKDLIGSINFGRWTEDGVVHVGRCSGMTDSERRWMTERQEELVGKVIEVSFNDLVGSKKYRSPRHPQFVRFRDPADKSPEECDGYELINKD